MEVHLPADAWILAAGALLTGGVLAAMFAERLRIPGLLLFLALGMLVGDDGLDILSLDDPLAVQATGAVALAVILFEGGLTTSVADVRSVLGPAVVLSTVVVVVTAAVVALGTWLLLDVDPLTAMLIGAVVSPTDAAAVFAALRRAPVPRRLNLALEVESGFNDPVAVLLVIGVLEAWAAQPTVVDYTAFAVKELGGGLLVGAGVGWVGGVLLARLRLPGDGLYPVLALGIAGLSYGLAVTAGASGFLAVYVAGVLVCTTAPGCRSDIQSFFQGLANTAEVALFLVLGLQVFPSRLPGVAVAALTVTAVLVFVARPLGVFLGLASFGFDRRELTLISWAGLRGAVPIVLATFAVTVGYPRATLVFNLVFFVVIVSAVLQGVTIPALARRLGLDDGREARTRVEVAADAPR